MHFDDFKCEVWVVQRPRPKRWFGTEPGTGVKQAFAMSSDSRSLARCDYNESFIRWELASKKVVSKMTARQPLTAGRIHSIQFTPRLDNVVVLANNGSLVCWDSSNGEQLGAAEPVLNAFNVAALPIELHINNTARTAIVVSQDGYVVTRELPALELIDRRKVSDEPVVASAYSPRLMALANDAGVVTLLDGSDLSAVGSIDGPADTSVAKIAVSVDGKCVSVAFTNGSIYVARFRKTASTANPLTELGTATQSE